MLEKGGVLELKKLRKSILFSLVISVCLSFLLAVKVFAQYQPPQPIGYVNDFAKVMSSESIINLNNLIGQLKSKTTAEIAVVTLNSLDGYPIEDIGLAIGRDWKLGAKGKDNGLVIVVAPSERKMRIEIGYGLEGYLTDAHAGRIRDNYMTPFFKQGNYDQGIMNGTVACAQTIAQGYGVALDGNYTLPQSQAESHPIQSLLFLIVLIYLFLKYPSFMIGFFFGGFGRGGGGSYGSSGGGFGGFSGGGGFGGGGCSGGW